MYTAGTKEYADIICDELDEKHKIMKKLLSNNVSDELDNNNSIFKKRFYRKVCVSCFSTTKLCCDLTICFRKTPFLKHD